MSCENDFDPCEELKKINELIINRAQSDIVEYTIAGRTVKKDDMRNLLRLRDVLKTECDNQKAAAKIAGGEGNPRKIKVRFM
jgi:hypothetical protein